jgi:hypothetical protein
MMLPMPFLRRIAPQLRQWRLPRLLLLVMSRRQARLSDILACLRRCRCGVALTCVLRRGVVAPNAILDVLDHVFCLVLQLIQKPMP